MWYFKSPSSFLLMFTPLIEWYYLPINPTFIYCGSHGKCAAQMSCYREQSWQIALAAALPGQPPHLHQGHVSPGLLPASDWETWLHCRPIPAVPRTPRNERLRLKQNTCLCLLQPEILPSQTSFLPSLLITDLPPFSFFSLMSVSPSNSPACLTPSSQLLLGQFYMPISTTGNISSSYLR